MSQRVVPVSGRKAIPRTFTFGGRGLRLHGVKTFIFPVTKKCALDLTDFLNKVATQMVFQVSSSSTIGARYSNLKRSAQLITVHVLGVITVDYKCMNNLWNKNRW